MTSNRQVVAVRTEFFNDGPWYVLSSTSLGGSSLRPEQLSEQLQSEDEDATEELLRAGVCLPLFFPGDCALDGGVRIVVGELNELEESEWLARIRSPLEIPCGEFLLLGGGMPEDFEEALEFFEAPNPSSVHFQKVRVAPGSYLVEVYAYVSSMTVNFAWEDHLDEKTVEAWFRRSRPGEEFPVWLNSYLEEGYVDSDQHNLLEYIIRLSPAVADVPLPTIGEYAWCSEFELRQPELCPLGICL